MVAITSNGASQASQAQFLQNTASTSSVSYSSVTISITSTSASAGQGNSGVIVDLSDRAKAILARANETQTVADRLQAYSDANRPGGTTSASQSRSPDIGQLYQQMIAGNSQTTVEQLSINVTTVEISQSNTSSVATGATAVDQGCAAKG